MGRRLLIASVIVGVLAFAPAALASTGAPRSSMTTTQTASLGDVSAKFSFKGNSIPTYRDEKLTITRAGVVAYKQPVSASLCFRACAPGSEGGSSISIHVLDLEHNGSPDVVLDLYSGGAHCCSIEQIFSFDPGTMTYVKTGRNFGDPGVRIADLRHNGRLEFETADDSFAYEFTDFAASGLPIQILTFSNRHFSNVTRHYRTLITRDAARWLRAFKSMAKQHYRDSVGVIAAWSADEELLGHTKLVNRYLARQAKAGHLNSALNPADSGKKFIAKLHRFLRAHGYLR
jgi:hypothetical protein